MTEGQREYLWRYTAIIALVLGVPSFLFAIVQLSDWFGDGPHLAATAQISPFSIPPQASAGDEGTPALFKTYKSYLIIQIGNDGNLDAENVRLQFPTGFEGVAVVERRGRRPKVHSFKDQLGLDVLENGGQMTVSAWSNADVGRINDRLVLVYRGASPISLRTKAPVFLRLADWMMFSMAMFLLVSLGVNVVFRLLSRRRLRYMESGRGR